MFKHEIVIDYLPINSMKPVRKTRAADLEIACQAGSPEEKSLIGSMFDYVISEIGGEDRFKKMWVSKVSVDGNARSWQQGDSVYKREPDPSKAKSAAAKQPPAPPAANPYTADDWREWVKPWQALGYDATTEIPQILSNAQKTRGGEPFVRMSGWDSTLDEASAIMTAYHAQNAQPAEPPPARPPAQQKPSPVQQARQNYDAMTSIEDKRNAIRIDYTIKISGKDYLQVQGRVLLFRLDHPATSGWGIECEVQSWDPDKGWAQCRAVVRDDVGRVIASGSGYCTAAGAARAQGRYIEKAETTAIGRALAIAGYGTDDSLTDDESYISDTPIGH